jgi:putative zinc finger protein
MQDQWTDRLSEYVDGDLDEAQRSALEAHLVDCGWCRTTLAELRRVVDRARAMDERPPARDLWPGIAGRIGLSTDDLAVRRARRRISFTVPQLIAAGVALIAVSAGTARLVSNRASTPTTTTAAASSQLTAVQAALWNKADSSADQEVDELRLALAEGQRSGQVNPVTIRKLERSLAVIDSAIAEAKRALALDPQSPYLNHHLADTMRRKLEFLREANRIATART